MILMTYLDSDEDLLICDFAEYYHVYDYKAIDIDLASTLAAGLRPNSRSYMKIHGIKANLTESLAASIDDELRAIIYMLSGKKNRKPEFIANRIIFGEPERTEYEKFRSPEEFWKRWNSI